MTDHVQQPNKLTDRLTEKGSAVFSQSNTTATNFFSLYKPAATIRGRQLLDSGVNKLQHNSLLLQ